MVERAKALGFAAIAITDHDSTDGLAEATEAGRELGVEVVPGIELSTLDGKKEVHILGYWIDPAAPELRAMLRRMIDSRENRAVRPYRNTTPFCGDWNRFSAAVVDLCLVPIALSCAIIPRSRRRA